MKKKILSITLIAVLLLGGVVGASSINGDYKGNPIVKVKVNGTLLDPEVPAQIADGSTLLPLRAVSEALGADVKWNPDSYSVDVTKSGDKIKLYSRISDAYINIVLLSDNFTDTNTKILTLYNSIRDNTDPDKYGQTATDTANRALNAYNYILDPTQKVITESANNGISVSDANELLTKLYNAGNDYKDALDIMAKYRNNRSTDLNPFFDKLIHAIGLVTEAKNSALEKYLHYYAELQKQ